MNAPLARYLTRFADAAAVVGAPAPVTIEPMVTMTVADLDARLNEARAVARAEAEAVHEALRSEVERTQTSAITDAVAAARAAWCDGTADEIAGTVERCLTTLHAEFAEATARVLRPLLTQAARERALSALETVVARLLADPSHPAVTLRAPADLVAALRARGMPDAIMVATGATTEAIVTCGSTHIETRLAAALADIAGT